MSEALSKLKKRIAQLLAMADSSSHPEEAASFAAKARQLMDEHGLSMGEAVADQNPLGTTEDEVPYGQGEYYSLASAAARYFGCDTLFRGRGEKGFTIFGREAARITVQLMIPYWVAECRKMGNKLAKESLMSRREAIHSVMDEFSKRLVLLTNQDPAQPVHSSLPVPVDEARSIMPESLQSARRMRDNEKARELAGSISVSQQMARNQETLRIS